MKLINDCCCFEEWKVESGERRVESGIWNFEFTSTILKPVRRQIKKLMSTNRYF